MKSQRTITLKLLTVWSLAILSLLSMTGQVLSQKDSTSETVTTEQNMSPPLTMDKIIAGLTAKRTTAETSTLDQKNSYIAKRVIDLGIAFELKPESEKSLKSAGANNVLIAVLRELTEKNSKLVTDVGARAKAKVFYERGFACDEKDYECQLLNFNEAIKIDPNYAEAYLGRGFAYGTKRFSYKDSTDFNRFTEQSIADYTKAIEINPNYVKAYYNRAYLYSFRNLELAFNDYNKAIQIDPNYGAAYVGRGIINKKQGNEGMAFADFTKAIQIDPNDKYAYYNRGELYATRNYENEKALGDLSKAIEIDTNYSPAYSARAQIYWKQKNYNSAIEDYTKLIQIKPLDSDIYYSRAFAYEKQNKLEQAIADFTKAIEIQPNPKGRSFHVFRGLAYLKQGKYDLALADSAKVIEMDQKAFFTEAYLIRGEVFFNQGKYDQSISAYTEAAGWFPSPLPYKGRGLVYAKQGKYEQAILYYTEAIKQESKDDEMQKYISIEQRLTAKTVIICWQ